MANLTICLVHISLSLTDVYRLEYIRHGLSPVDKAGINSPLCNKLHCQRGSRIGSTDFNGLDPFEA